MIRDGDRWADTRVAYGTICTWWGSIYDVGSRSGLPCCPYCGSMLFEMDHERKFIASANKYEKEGHPGYPEMIKWAKGKRCYKSIDALTAAYQQFKETVN